MVVRMDKFILISTGAVLGANLRYWVGDWAAQRWSASLPYGTLLVNLTGSLLLGFLMTLIADRLVVDPRWRLFFAVGFLGAYTTFSTYMFESFALLEKGQWLLGLGNLLGSSLMGLLAVGAGIYLAKMAVMQVEWLARVMNAG